MRRFSVALIAAVIAAACGGVHPPKPPVGPPKVAFDLVLCQDAVEPESGNCMGASVPFPHVTVNAIGHYDADGAGYLYVSGVDPSIVNTEIAAALDGWEDFDSGPITVQSLLDRNTQGRHNGFPMHQKSHDVDPSTIPLNELARFMGAMWPRANTCLDAPSLPWGPRSGRTDNIIGTPYLDNYTAAQQESIAHCLSQAGYLNVVTGGIVDDWGYHGWWKGHDYSDDAGMERWLDQHQFFWNHGLRPVTFFHVDGESFDQTAARMRQFAAHPRAQKLVRIFIPSGWEPARYEWSSCTWAKYVALGHELFPNALIGIHTVTETDGPVGTDSLCDDNGKPNGQGWQRVVAAGLQFWLVQNGPYAGAPGADPTQTRNFRAQFQPDGDGADTHSAAWHFKYGIDSWPASSVWGQGVPVCMVGAEQTAYEATWNNRPDEPSRRGYGDLTQAPGSVACGYLDGGAAVVPIRR